MRQSRWATAYAILCTLGMLVGAIVAFIYAGLTMSAVWTLLGVALGVILAPIVHEMGHIFLAKCNGMKIVYSKFFCFQLQRKGKRLRFGFASPFAAEQTQVVPKYGENMRSRAMAYTLGGLLFSGVLCALVLLFALIFKNNFCFWGILPYTAYLFFLNLAPFYYSAGKTDMLVFIGLKKGYDVEENMLSAMKIQGFLFAGESFAQIDRALYFDVPQLREDEPLYAVMLDLRYRYYLEKGDVEDAADCLNRLVVSQEYLTQEEVERIAAECVYMHALNGDRQRADECGLLCKAYLSGESASAKRILAAYSCAFGKAEAVAPLKEQAEKALRGEMIKGVAQFERILLSRIECV